MPLATRPNQKYEFVLSTDMELPEESRPVFIFRYLNVLDWEQIAGLNDKIESTRDGKEALRLLFEVIEKTLVGWRNMKNSEGQEVEFNLMLLKSMVSMPEARELLLAAMAQMPNIEDKKKLSSQSTLNTASAITPAANAKTPTNAGSEPDKQK